MSNIPRMIRILAVDDHALLRKGLAAVINAEPDLKLVAEASNGEEAIENFSNPSPRCDSDGSSNAWAQRNRGDEPYSE